MSNASFSPRIVFAGTPEFAAAHLQALLAAKHNLVAVYSQPDRRSGRGKKLTPSPVKCLALQHALPVEQPETFKSDEALATLEAYQADLMIVVAYGMLLPESVLRLPKWGCLNVHASLLPRWRGAAPIQRAIAAGDQDTGVTLMQMDAGLDTGPMISSQAVAITPEDTGASLQQKLIDAGVQALLALLAEVTASGEWVTASAQPEVGVSYAHKLQKAEGRIDWQQPADALERTIRAFYPNPGTFTEIGETRIKVHQAQLAPLPANAPRQPLPGTVLAVDARGILVACGRDALLLTQVQLPGKKPVRVAEFIQSQTHIIQPQYVFSSTAW